MNRLYAVESTPTNTGHARPITACRCAPREIEAFARAVAAQLGVRRRRHARPRRAQRWVDAARRATCRPRAAAASSSPATASRPSCTRWRTRSTTRSATSARPSSTRRPPKRGRRTSCAALQRAGRRDERRHGRASLLILGGNPVYTAPADLQVRRARCEKVPLRVHLGLYHDETARAAATGTFPRRTSSRAWSDVRADDGTVSIVQPLIAPLYGGESAHEVVAALGDGGEQIGYDLVARRLDAGARRHRRRRPAPPRTAPAADRRTPPRRRRPTRRRRRRRPRMAAGLRSRARAVSRPSIATGAAGCTTA